MTTAQLLQIPFTEFHETGNFIHSQTTKLPKFQENTQNIWNFQKNNVPLRVNKQNSQKPSHMPTLTWIGKEKVVNHHLDVPFRVLDRQYTFGDTPDSGNKIIHGDNLEALKALLPEYEGKIKCIYIDPPYNTGNEKWVYNDNVNDPHIRKWLGQVVGSEMDDLTRHDKWLCMMYPRLVLLQKLLKDDGAIFISIDDNELYFLKCICDEIFGKANYLCSICIKNDSRARPYNSISVTHEYLLVYTGANFIANSLHDKSKKFQYKDEFGGYDLYELRNRNSDFNSDNRPNLYYPFWVNPNNEIEKSLFEIDLVEHEGWIKFYPQESQGIKTVWRWGKEKAQENLNTVIFGRKAVGGWQVVKKYRDDIYALPSVWDDADVSSDRGTLTMKKFFNNKRVFAFPKSPELIQRCLQLASDPDSIILDSFAGSGTTAHAVLNLNKQDGGNRKFILVELGDYAENITAERVRRVISGYGEGKNAVEGTGGSFDFYELGDTLFDPKTENLNDNADTEQIRQYVWYSETHAPYIAPTAEHHPYWLGTDQRTNYYFYYIKGEETCLSWDFLRTLTPERDKAEMYIIYADRCVLTESEMQQLNIRFKKIPRDIKRV
jgi:adenine-specific DNA-methyltransferase